MELKWWKSLYDQQMADLFLHREKEQSDQEISLLEDLLQLQHGDHILDQCCGTGSLSIPLADRGYRVTGVDIMPKYIQQARDDSKSDMTVFHCADAAEFVASSCDAGFNWWTGFGYGSDQQSKDMLGCAFRSLRTGGRFLLDFVNAPGIIRHFQPSSHLERNGISLTRESTIDWHGGRLQQRWIFKEHDEKRVVDSSVRFYQPHELVILFQEAGFVEIQLFGDRKKQALTIDSMRCICVGRKP